MLRAMKVLAVASLVHLASAQGSAIEVAASPSANAAPPPLEAFVSYSIEFSSFTDFAGNLSSPNTFSNNLLNNLGALTGTKPYIRVGGNTQDFALYNASLKTAINGTYNVTKSPDYPTTIFIGPSFFESFSTWTDTKYIFGFNLGLGASTAAGWESLFNLVPVACKGLRGKLLWWEYGNEPDLYASNSARGPVRPPTWNESTYIEQWLNGTRLIKSQLEKHCPDMTSDTSYGYYAPSFGGTGNKLDLNVTFAEGLNVDQDVKIISSHNYIGGATQPGISLQGTLMNHSSTVHSISSQVAEESNVSYTGIPFILGETNSLYNQGAPGLSNAFGAALWGLDFNLWCASVGIRRVHMHQGTNYRYASWQPIETNITSIGTKAPYYGNIAVASVLGNLVENEVHIVNLPLESVQESAYAAYVGGQLKRIAVINLREYNYTVNGTSSVPNPVPRPSKNYSFAIPEGCGGEWVDVKRLAANGSDAVSGITWDGWSYNYELDLGKPVRLNNVTTGEKAQLKGGVVSVTVVDSSATILEFN